MFVAGAAFSLREGIAELIHPSVTSSFAVAYVVLAVSTVFDLVSFRRSAGQMIGQARRFNRNLLEESRVTSDPSLRAVFVEDAVSVSGDVIAFAGLALNQITGSSIPQGVAAVLIGLVLIRFGLRLARRSHDFLVGAWLLVFIPATRELSTAMFLYGPKTRTMSVMLMDMSEEGNFEHLAALGFLLLLATLAIVGIASALLGRDFMLRRDRQ